MSKPSFSIRKTAESKTQCLVVPIFKDHTLSKESLRLDRRLEGIITNALNLGDFTGNSGETVVLVGNESTRRILLVGCGDTAEFDRYAQRKFTETTANTLAQSKACDTLITLTTLPSKLADFTDILESLSCQITMACYIYTKTVSEPKNIPVLTKVMINTGNLISTVKSQESDCMRTSHW